MATGDAYSLNQLFGGRDIGTVVEVRALPSGRPPRLALRCSRLKGRFALSGSPLARFAPRDPAKPLTRCAPRRPLRCRPRGEPRRIVPTLTCASVASLLVPRRMDWSGFLEVGLREHRASLHISLLLVWSRTEAPPTFECISALSLAAALTRA